MKRKTERNGNEREVCVDIEVSKEVGGVGKRGMR